jgi:hypothetical protein
MLAHHRVVAREHLFPVRRAFLGLDDQLPLGGRWAGMTPRVLDLTDGEVVTGAAGREGLEQCSEIECHHYWRLLSGIIFLAGELLNLESVPFKAHSSFALGRLAALNVIERFTGYPAMNEGKTIHHYEPDATCEFESGLIECCQHHRIRLRELRG